FPKSLDFGEKGDVLQGDGRWELVGMGPAEDGKCKLGSDPADIVDQQKKKVPLGPGEKPVKNMGVFAHLKIGLERDLLTGERKFFKGRKRNQDLIADIPHIQDYLVGKDVDEFAFKKCDHGFKSSKSQI